MKLQEYLDKHGNVEINEQELNDLLGIKESKVWKPKNDEFYNYINECGDIRSTTFNNCFQDKERFAIGNVFKTDEEAEFILERLKVITELKRYAQEHNECEIDWNDDTQDKYFISYDFENYKILYGCTFDLKCNEIYFSSKEIAMNCVKEVGEDRIKKYYLGVEE